jgi:hypothetical protein
MGFISKIKPEKMPDINMKEKDLRQFKAALTRHLFVCRTKHLLNCILPVEKSLDLLRHIIGLFKKYIRKIK